MHPATTINILLSWLCDHRKIKHELCPVAALSHLLQRGFAGFKLAVQSRTHHRQMLDTEPFFPRLQMSDFTVREQRINWLMQRLNFPLVKRDSDQLQIWRAVTGHNHVFTLQCAFGWLWVISGHFLSAFNLVASVRSFSNCRQCWWICSRPNRVRDTIV